MSWGSTAGHGKRESAEGTIRTLVTAHEIGDAGNPMKRVGRSRPPRSAGRAFEGAMTVCRPDLAKDGRRSGHGTTRCRGGDRRRPDRRERRGSITTSSSRTSRLTPGPTHPQVVVGDVLPEQGVTIYPVPPQYGVTAYDYTVVDNTPVLVDPRTRRVVEVVP